MDEKDLKKQKSKYVQGVSKKRLFYDSCFTGGSGLLQGAGYQSKTLAIIFFRLIALLLTQLPILIPFWHTQGGPNTVKDCSKLPVVKVIH